MPRPRPLRRSLVAAALEGAPADAFVTLSTGSALTAWALALEAPPLYLAALQSMFVGMQVLHPLGAWLTQHAPRRRLATTAVLTSRLVWLVMAGAVYLEAARETSLTLLFAVTVISSGSQVLRENAQGTWFGDVVPARVRGRFFAQRSRMGVAAASLGSLLLAILLDGGGGPALGALAVVAILVSVLGLVSAGLLQRIEAPPPPSPGPRLREVLADARVHPLLLYQLSFAFAVSPGMAFFSYWVLHRMEGTFLMLAGHAAILAIARIVSAPFWGRMVDLRGARNVLFFCSIGTASMPLLWMSLRPGFLWPLILDAIVSGALWGGHAIAMFDAPLRVSTAQSRPQVLALSAMAAGFGWMAGSVIFGRVTEVLPALTSYEPLRVVFLLCALARCAAGFLALRVFDAPRAARPAVVV